MVQAGRLLALLGALSLLSACGGGGGGDGNGGTPDPPVQTPVTTPPPPAPPLTLTPSNTVDAASLVLRQIEYVHTAAGSMILAADVLTYRNEPSFTLSCTGNVLTTLSNRDVDRSGNISRGDELRVEHASCHGLTSSTRMVITLVDFAAGKLEGRVEFVFSTDTGTRTEGTFVLTSTFDAMARKLSQTMSQIDVTVATGTSTAAIRNATSQRSVERSELYRVSFSGEANSPALGGEFTFDTPAALGGLFGNVPDSGEVELASGTSRARITPSASQADRFDYAVYMAGTTAPVAVQTAPWSAVVEGYIFCWDSNTPPAITSLSLLPANPAVSDQLVASFTATDADGDALTYWHGWLVNGALQPVDLGTTLPLARFRKGDVVTFIARASDSRITTDQTASVTIANSPPEILAVRFEPPVARTADRIDVFHESTDDDGEPGHATFEWRRNGTTIPGATGQSLPHTAHAKGDVITAIVHVSDGDATASASGSITIADTPPVVALPSTIDSVAYGQIMTFDVTASDDDDEPVGNFVLAYGPAGMSINPTTGRISWPMRGPAFEREAQMNFGVTLTRTGANVATSSVALQQPTREEPIYRTGFEAPVTSALKVGDFDGDGDEELLIASQDAVYELEWTGTTYRQSWVHPFPFQSGMGGPAALATADVDGDGRHEIFVAYGNIIVKLDGIERRYEASGGYGLFNHFVRDLEIADVDNDGQLEVIAISSPSRSGDPAASGALMRLRADTLGLSFTYAMSEGSAVAVGNVDNDAALEIVTNSGYVFDGATWREEWRYLPAFGWEVDVGDLDGNGVEEIVASVAGGAVRAYDAIARTASWTIANADSDAIVIADVVGDADEEVLIGDGVSGSGMVKIYAQTAPGVTTLLGGVATIGDDVPAIATGDVDDDGQLEVIFGSTLPASSLVVAGGAPLAIEWTTDDLDHEVLIGPYVGGKLARRSVGTPAVLFASARSLGGGMRLIGMNPNTGDITVSSSFGDPGNGMVALTVVDYDTDGTDEVLIASSSDTTAYHSAYDFFSAANQWSTTFSSTQNGIAVAHGDLTGDGRADLASIDNQGIVRAYDIWNNALLWTGPTLGQGHDVAIAELNGGGRADIVVAAGDHVRLYSRDGNPTYTQIRVTGAALPGLRDIDVGDIDGDGALDILALYSSPAKVRRLDAALTVRGGFDYWREGVRGLVIEKSTFARKNLVLIDTLEGDQLVVVDAASGEEIWQSPTLYGAIARDGVQFIDPVGNGNLRISVATSLGTYLTR